MRKYMMIGLVASAVAGAGGAQPIVSKRPPWEGLLANPDPRDESGAYTDRFEMYFSWNEFVSIEMQSPSLHPRIVVVGPNGFRKEARASAASNSVRLEFVPPNNGAFRVWATSARPGETGRYTMRLTTIVEPPPPVATVNIPERPAIPSARRRP